METEARLNALLDDLSRYVEYQRDEGVTRVELDPEAVAELGEPIRSPAAPADALAEVATRVASCEKCPLHQGRTLTVPGQGSPVAELMFVGEGPGADEDRAGLAFVGAAGRLLTKMILRMGFTREEVFIANIVKCRPPGNRAPLPDEMSACLPYLKEQIAILRPKAIMALGGTAAKGLLNTQIGITRLRGTWMKFDGIGVMPTFHPSYLLRLPKARWDAWEDMKKVLDRLGREVPPDDEATP